MGRVVDDVLDRVLVLILRFDQPRPEPPAEDMVLSAVALVEGAGVLAVEVSHALREVWKRRFDEEVVVVSEQAADVEAPAVAALHAPQDVNKGGPVPDVGEDGRVVVPLRSYVVVGTGGEVAAWTSHPRRR